MAFRALSHPTRTRRTTSAALITSVVGVVAVAGGVALVSALGPTGAGAEDSRRPLPTADVFAGYAGGEYTVDVLANDTTSVLSTGDLTLCGVTVDEQTARSVFADVDATDPDVVHLETNRTSAGTVTFSYDACQGSQRATSTVTVTIARPEPLTVTRASSRGRLVVSNPNAGPVRVLWGSNRTAGSDGNRAVPGNGSITIAVSRPTVAWLGYLQDRGAVIAVGDGTVTGIKQAS